MVRFSRRDLSYETDSGPKTKTVSDPNFQVTAAAATAAAAAATAAAAAVAAAAAASASAAAAASAEAAASDAAACWLASGVGDGSLVGN